MKRSLLAVVIGLALAQGTGGAQPRSPFEGFSDAFNVSCWGWQSLAETQGRFDRNSFFHQATQRAAVYGFVRGAAYASPERLRRITALGVDIWIDRYCETHRRSTVGIGVQILVEELSEPR